MKIGSVLKDSIETLEGRLTQLRQEEVNLSRDVEVMENRRQRLAEKMEGYINALELLNRAANSI